MMDEIQTYLGADGLMHCTVCKEPVEAFYPKGSLLEMKKHHRQCACERQAYAEEAQYFKEKERRELVVRNKKICFEEKEMEGFTFQNVDRDSKDENVEYEKELNAELAKLQKTRQKYMDMYTDDLISREELNEKIGGSRQEMERIENELKMVSYHLTKGEQLENILNNTFKEIEDITDVHQMTNQQLKRLIQKIEVDKEGNVDIYLRLLGDLGLDESVLIEENETVLNCDDQT